MAGHSGSRWRVIVVVGGILWLVASVAIVGVALGRDLEIAANIAQLVFVPLTVVSAVAALMAWRPRSSVLPSRPTKIDRAKDVLVEQVRKQWTDEAVARSLDDPPDSMPVKWQLTAHGELMDHPEHVATNTPVFAGSSAQIGDLADQFRALRRRRLVILGGPGTGKTTLAVQLLLELIRSRRVDEPVPVLLSVASWDTRTFPRLQDWLTVRLAQDYPSLRAAELGAELPRTLAADRHILPVLDGLDELPDGARAAIISALKQSLKTPDDQVILTSRTIEYAQAVQAIGSVLTSAAVIKPHQLTPSAAAGYLRACLPTEPGQAWEKILTSLETSPHNEGPAAALTKATSTPLGLWLVRATYAERHADPTPLLDPDRFPNTTALRAHLLDKLIPALIATRQPSSQNNTPASPFLPRRLHDPAQVRRWLSYLAHHLTTTGGDSDQGTRDFAWWRLAATTHAITRTTQLALTLLTTLTVGLTAGLTFELAYRLTSGPAVWLASGPAVGFTVGPAVGLAVGLGARSWARHLPGYANLRIRQRSAELGRKLAGGLVLGLAFGLVLGFGFGFGLVVVLTVGTTTQLVVGLVAGLAIGLVGKLVLGLMTRYGHAFKLALGLASGLALVLVVVLATQLVGGLMTGLMTQLMYGLVLGLALGLAVGFMAWVETPAQAHHATTPMGNWYTDRTLNLVRISTNALAAGLPIGLASGLVVGLADGPVSVIVIGLTGGFVNGLVYGLLGGLVYGLLFGLAIGLGFGKHRAWLAYLLATWQLARTGLLPRQLMPFLDDMHRLGLLRAVGPIYQFRHAALQDHLAAAYRSSEQASGH